MNHSIVTQSIIERKIFFIRGHKVMLDIDLAILYGVPTKRLNEQVRRNARRFPPDFMFHLTLEETAILRSQFATSSWGGQRYLPCVFTQDGVAMLSSVLNSSRAIDVNIQIIRTFNRMRGIISSHKELEKKIKALEKKHNKKFSVVFNAIRSLLDGPESPVRVRGFGLSARNIHAK